MSANRSDQVIEGPDGKSVVRFDARRAAGAAAGLGRSPGQQESAQGNLVAALGVLAKHFGIRDVGERDARVE